MPDVIGMSHQIIIAGGQQLDQAIAPVRPNLDRARRLPAGDPLPSIPTTPPSGAAQALADMTREAVAAAVPYAGPGGELDAELEVKHVDRDGSQTTAKLRFRFHR